MVDRIKSACPHTNESNVVVMMVMVAFTSSHVFILIITYRIAKNAIRLSRVSAREIPLLLPSLLPFLLLRDGRLRRVRLYRSHHRRVSLALQTRATMAHDASGVAE